MDGGSVIEGVDDLLCDILPQALDPQIKQHSYWKILMEGLTWFVGHTNDKFTGQVKTQCPQNMEGDMWKQICSRHELLLEFSFRDGLVIHIEQVAMCWFNHV